MPVQIQGDVEAVYEPVITIADTGEVLTEAQIYDTTLALANRIEFVRQAQTVTPNISYFRDDFLHVQEVNNPASKPVGNVWHGDTPWVAEELVSPFTVVRVAPVIRTSADAAYHNNPGRMRIDSITGPAGINFSKFRGAAGVGIPCKYVTELIAIVQPLFAGSGMKIEFGMKATGAGVGIDDPNSAAISFLFDPAQSGNWLAKTSLNAGSSTHYEDTGVAPSTSGSMQKLVIRRTQIDPDVATDFRWDWYISGTLVATKINLDDTYFIPDIETPAVLRFAVEVPDLTASNEAVEVDWISGEFTFETSR